MNNHLAISPDDFKLMINSIKDEHKTSGNIWKPIRISISGQEHGPDISRFISILGSKECVQRLDSFLNLNVY